MANLNKVLLMGNLTRDPELRYLPSGSQVAEFGLAVNRRWNDPQSGEQREQVCFVDLVSYGRQAETLHKYMKKGRGIFVEGRLDFQSWDTPEGQKRSKLRVVVETFQFLGAGQKDESGVSGDGPEAGGAPAPRPRPNRSSGGSPASASPNTPSREPAFDEEDIPF